MKFKIYEDYDGTIYEVDLPLSSNIDIKQVSEELEMPNYIEIDNFAVKRALLTIWAAVNAQRINFSEEVKKKLRGPLTPLLFGGMTVKIHCPSANKPNGPLNRHVKDVDFVIQKHEGSLFVKLMLELNKLFGSCYLYFITQGERWFNLLRGGKRYRVRGLSDITNDGIPQVGVTDIFCDELPFRHTIKIDEKQFKRAKENLYTIGLENLLLSKCQFIFSLPKDREIELRETQQEFRILPYKYLKNEIAVGMEFKDMKDVAAILLDHEIGEGPEQISIDNIKRILGGDKKFTLTFRLNLQNLIDRINILEKEGLSTSDANKIIDRVNQILEKIPTIDKKWEKPWWNVDVETPKIRQ
ncbi:MAG: hypothetical protein MRT15_08760 [archaeon YNP-LCB-003-016]|uniref:hypothetical protein n=1 Tax=Candidatus Culexarchaeum yellowstonense TaxID=2928963 RepID=UPI0026EBF857|nr:hypothetical protein [Candidatus Culexarchaeum yellowstonense]MCR6692470.1 hypothetical protein [Candidatus Culexarchaeum yellowstonense]